MGQPAAKQGDQIFATDTHIVLVPSVSGSVPTPLPHLFSGLINGNTSGTVRVMGRAAAVVGSTADNSPPHLPTPPGVAFQKPPTNRATIQRGSLTVRINGKSAARNNDPAMTCNDPVDAPVGMVMAVGTVLIGG